MLYLGSANHVNLIIFLYMHEGRKDYPYLYTYGYYHAYAP